MGSRQAQRVSGESKCKEIGTAERLRCTPSRQHDAAKKQRFISPLYRSCCTASVSENGDGRGACQTAQRQGQRMFGRNPRSADSDAAADFESRNDRADARALCESQVHYRKCILQVTYTEGWRYDPDRGKD